MVTLASAFEMASRLAMGFPRASLALLITLPGCGLFLDTQTPEGRQADAHVALDAATSPDAFEASDAPGMDAYADDAYADDAYADDAFVLDTGRDARVTPDAVVFDTGVDAPVDANDPCATGFCGLDSVTLGPSAIDLDVSEDGRRIAILTGAPANRTIVYRFGGGIWMERANNAAATTCRRVAVSDQADVAGVLCGPNLNWVGASSSSSVTWEGPTPEAIAAGGNLFAVAVGDIVQVYEQGVGTPFGLPVDTAMGCVTATQWTPLVTSTVLGLAIRAAEPWSCTARANLVAGIAARPHRIHGLAGQRAECATGAACCSTPIAGGSVDALHGADIAMLGALVVSSSDLGRPRFVGEVSNLPAVRDRGAGQVVSVSLGASLVDSHFVLGSVHVPLGGDAGAWIQHESRDIAACTSEPLNEVEIFRAPRGRSISKIRISDCDDSTGMMTAAVLEAPPIMDRIADGTAHVYRLRCPTRLP